MKRVELAERVGFEPTSRFLVNTLSKRAPSATRTPLRVSACDANLLEDSREEVPASLWLK